MSVVPQAKNRNATWSFWLGLFSLFVLGPILGIPAIILGARARREINESAVPVKNASMATVGLVLGWITTIAWVLGWVIAGIAFWG